MARLVEASEAIRLQTRPTPTRASVARARRRRNRGPQAGRSHGDGWRRSEQDDQLLQWITRLGAMSIRQAHRYVYSDKSYNTARLRIGSMVQAGLLNRLDTLPWAGTVLWPTVNGRIAGVGEESPLRGMEAPADSTMLHRLLVGEEALKRLAANKTIITEREARLYEIGSATASTEDRDHFLHNMGVHRCTDGSTGVVPSTDGDIERWMTLPTPHGTSAYRIPDLLEVTDDGGLRAIEVETSPKQPSRMRTILSGYRDACLGHNPVPKGHGDTLRDAGQLRRQFVGVHWVSTDAVLTMLRGPESGINPISGKPDVGLVRDIWGESASTHLFYESKNTWALNNIHWPVSASRLDISVDPGIEYALHQRTLPATYRTSMNNWRKWRALWEEEVGDDTNPVDFTHWLQHPGNLGRCLDVTR